MARSVIVLVMHGEPPRDFPRESLTEYFTLHERLHAASPEETARLRGRVETLERAIREWPRSARNDPFYAGSLELAEALQRRTGLRVIVGFNEFCAPSLPEALDRAAAQAREVFVVTPMMTRGGVHAESDIPRQLEQARKRHPGVRFVYAWPYGVSDVAAFLARHLERFGMAVPAAPE
ncbi:MAG: CbiX/SirB N-terminal domain-containing protein [Bacillota bacterium]